jgi:hypothetical protein
VNSADRVLNETILGVDKVNAKTGETDPLKRSNFREINIGSTEISIVHIPREAEL